MLRLVDELKQDIFEWKCGPGSLLDSRNLGAARGDPMADDWRYPDAGNLDGKISESINYDTIINIGIGKEI
jgi:hypothetical protein